jgi:hypothetical protein
MNKPVAWAMFVDGDFWDAIHPEEHDRVEGKYTVPLYIHPAKTLTPLTDDEIEIECRKAWNLNDQYRLNLEEVIRFAHAILRKAQEK